MESKSDFNPKKIAVIGAGPVGCIVAAFLSKGGLDVTLCDIIPELVQPAIQPGIKIQGAENFQAGVTRTCTQVDELADSKPDIIVVASKANAVPLIASAIESFYHDGMYVISWQNGIDTEREIANVLGAKAVMRAVVNFGCNLLKPCTVSMAFHHHPHFLQELDPKSREIAVAICNLFSATGLHTEHTDQIIKMVWRKTILNACMNPVCAVTGLTMAEAMNDPIIFQIVSNLVKECIKIARDNEIPLGWDFYPNAISYMKSSGHHKPSMLIDIEKNRKTEIEFMNGKFIEFGNQANIEAPFNTTMRALVKGLESKQK